MLIFWTSNLHIVFFVCGCKTSKRQCGAVARLFDEEEFIDAEVGFENFIKPEHYEDRSFRQSQAQAFRLLVKLDENICTDLRETKIFQLSLKLDQ